MNVPLFRRILGREIDCLPPVLLAAHDAVETQRWEGLANVTGSGNPLARLLCRAMRLPARGQNIPVTVIFERHSGRERWLRTFGTRSYTSVLAAERGLVRERMGPVTNLFRLSVEEGTLRLDLEGFRVLGLPMPAGLRPRCHAVEIQRDGRYVFDVPIDLPWLGRVIRYTGSMERRDG